MESDRHRQPSRGRRVLRRGFFVGDSDKPFWPSTIPGPYVKVTFTLVLAAMALVVFLGYRQRLLERHTRLPTFGARTHVILVIAGLLGGFASALVGSGADVFVYLFVVVLFGVTPKVGVASSVIVMTVVSVAGIIVLGIFDGQLATHLEASGDVVSVGGETVAPLEASQYDLFGLWIAAVPIVAWGAPLGSWVSSQVKERQLVSFVVALAVAEVVSTAIFLDELRDDSSLLLFAIVGLVIALGGLWLVYRYRRRLLGLPPVDLDRSFTRARLDVADDYQEQLE